MRRVVDYLALVLLFPFLALLGFGLAVADPFRLTQLLTAAGKQLRPLFEPVNCRKCHGLLTSSANDEHAGIRCNCLKRHSAFCKGRTAE